MEAGYTRLVKRDLSPTERVELDVVDDLAQRLKLHLSESAEQIRRVHVHGAGSSVVQAIVASLLSEHLDFAQEVVLTPQTGFVTRARPDFVHRLSPGRGVLAEVERGGTTTNNHDLKDLWKTHIASDAQHLFLVVPMANWNQAGLPRERPFTRVSTRMGAFFGDPRREVDVASVHVFGYGAGTV